MQREPWTKPLLSLSTLIFPSQTLVQNSSRLPASALRLLWRSLCCQDSFNYQPLEAHTGNTEKPVSEVQAPAALCPAFLCAAGW